MDPEAMVPRYTCQSLTRNWPAEVGLDGVRALKL